MELTKQRLAPMELLRQRQAPVELLSNSFNADQERRGERSEGLLHWSDGSPEDRQFVNFSILKNNIQSPSTGLRGICR